MSGVRSSVALIPIPKSGISEKFDMLLVRKASHLLIYMHMCAACVKLAMSTVEEASGSDLLERKKRSTTWSFVVIDNEDKTKPCVLLVRRVSRGGKHSKSFNTSNLCKHLEGHEDKFKDYIEQEKKRQELSSSKGSYKQATLEALAEKHKLTIHMLR